MRDFWSRLSGPLKIGLAIGLLGALLTVIGLVKGDFAPLTLRTLLLGILLGGGSWGLVSWAIASAAADATGSAAADATGSAEAEATGSAGAEATESAVVDATDPGAVEPGTATIGPTPIADQEPG
jgi:predicted lipid-binding transport protein (Tim44 family)